MDGTSYGKKVSKTSALVFVFLATSTAFAQQEPVAEVELGRTMQEVMQVFGPPQKCYVRDISEHRFTPTECQAAEQVYDDVRDVYSRKTTTNEYELRMNYRVDLSKSRLHPDLRLESVELVIDKPKPFAEIASDRPEVGKLCAEGCFRFGTIWDMSGMDGPALVLYPKKQTKEDRANADKIASGFEETTDKEGQKDWTFAICMGWTDHSLMDRTHDTDFSSDGKIVYHGPTANDIDWLKHPIEKVQIAVQSPSWMRSMREPPYGPAPAVVEVGEYKP